MNLVLTTISMVLAAFVILACICRVNALDPDKHQYLWTIKYSLFAAFAGGEVLQVVYEIDAFTMTELAGLVGIAIHLIATRPGWRNGPPTVAQK